MIDLAKIKPRRIVQPQPVVMCHECGTVVRHTDKRRRFCNDCLSAKKRKIALNSPLYRHYQEMRKCSTTR